MKIGIVVPFSWSFWGAVVEHAELQADALEDLQIQNFSEIGYQIPNLATNVQIGAATTPAGGQPKPA